MALQKLTLTIRKGSAEDIPIRLESEAWSYASISAVAQSAPLRITASAVPPDGWRAAIMNVKAVGDFAAQSNPPKDSDLRSVAVVDPTTVEFNAINGAAFRAHTSGGQLAWRTPVDLNLYVGARMNVREKVGGPLVANWTTDTNELEIDVANRVLWLRLDDSATELLTAKNKVFDIELIRTGGNADRVCAHDSTLIVLDETTTE
ncbi:MAG: hypothetical protein RBT67_02740 [Thauera sp.]|nr:hypothetical protein [Thauera sp.]